MTEHVRASLDHCVKCTICETFCPVANVTPLFPGPKYAGPQAERYRLGERDVVDASVDYCSGCGICTLVCPQGVKIAELNSQARAALKSEQGVTVRDRMLSRPVLAGMLATPVAPLANAVLGNRVARSVAERTVGIHRDAPLPRYAGRTFQSASRKRRSGRGERGSVVYFHGCSTNYNEPRLGEMTVDVLERNGLRVVVPPQGCCGLPRQSNGLFDEARDCVRTLVGYLAPHARAGLDIVATSTSCSLMLKREASEILGLEGDPALEVVGARTWDICEYLLALHDRGDLDTDFTPLDLTVPYHAPCQQRSHGIGKPALDLFALIPGLRVVELQRDCCGVAGTYGLKREKYEIAMDVGAPLFADIRGAEADVVACDSETCRWQITHGSGVGSVHPIELLHRAYGLPPRS